jgi:hypothetical protein
MSGFNVPLAQCRPGAVIEFYVQEQSYVGQVDCVDATRGYKSYLVHLTNCTIDGEEEPPMQKAARQSMFGGKHMLRLQDAVRVLQHGKGAVVYYSYLAANRPSLDEHEAYMRSSNVRRCGHHLHMGASNVFDNDAEDCLRRWLWVYLAKHKQELGYLSTEMIDSFKMLRQMCALGIVKRVIKEDGRNEAVLNTEKAKRFIRQNLSRFKRNLNQAIRDQQLEHAAFAARYRRS